MKKWHFITVITVLVFIVSVSAFAGEPLYNITAGPRSFLIGGLGDTGDSFRYNGRGIQVGKGYANINVNERTNTGRVIAVSETSFGTLTFVLKEFGGTEPYIDGGISKNLYLHGTTGNGPPVLPKSFTYLAGWGRADVYLNGKILYKNYDSHFMLTEGVRDKDTFKVDFKGPKNAKAYPGSVANPGRQVLHIVVHSDDTKKGNLPPYRIFLHAMWDGVTWN